ncbi:hypothetical protein PMG71_12450 [Roseofilum sp. BLCC_M154]|uniref:Uncharacterized protein n=1 Tax=Roseofilum acuticapitatum BLCC-M154 TaxID=3022444 RepID=A0ABT7AUG9_9CYAN|nr:hypothetical protein [Roseofilum acuticapitatum]MDJ1170242.1 hypothetical protein [Roseofilum acuticapitatum BLCC-M154]
MVFLWELALGQPGVTYEGSEVRVVSIQSCGEDFEQLIEEMVRDFTGYANRVMQRHRDRFKPYPIPSVITVGKPDFDPLPLPFGAEIPENSRQVFLTALERTYQGLTIVDREVYYWLFLTETEGGWELVLLLSAVTDGERLVRLPESREGAIAEAVRLWLRDYQFSR